MYSVNEGAKLIQLARHSIETFIEKKPLDLEDYKSFTLPQGVFIAIKKQGMLRGQGGFVESSDPLYKNVVKAARDAAFRDKRFTPLTKEELVDITVELTIVLTKPQLIRVLRWEDYKNSIHIGYDGILVKAGVFSGIILPQTLGEGWDFERLLRQLCLNAGMTMDSWKDLSHQIFKFQVQVFAEKENKIVEII